MKGILTDSELEAIAARHAEFLAAHGAEQTWCAYQCARDIPGLLATVREQAELLRQAEDARAEVPA